MNLHISGSVGQFYLFHLVIHAEEGAIECDREG